METLLDSSCKTSSTRSWSDSTVPAWTWYNNTCFKVSVSKSTPSCSNCAVRASNAWLVGANTVKVSDSSASVDTNSVSLKASTSADKSGVAEAMAAIDWDTEGGDTNTWSITWTTPFVATKSGIITSADASSTTVVPSMPVEILFPGLKVSNIWPDSIWAAKVVPSKTWYFKTSCKWRL